MEESIVRCVFASNENGSKEVFRYVDCKSLSADAYRVKNSELDAQYCLSKALLSVIRPGKYAFSVWRQISGEQ